MALQKKSDGPSATQQDFPIVGIGASSGGLDAFRKFLAAVPEDSGMAYVLVQHLHPEHESILPEILARSTKIPVNEIIDNIHLAPNNIYIIPENKVLTSTDGILKLTPRKKDKLNNAIDVFFLTLADVHKELAIGIVLSGTGADGTEGLKAIKKNGGYALAQDQSSAAYVDMPKNAVNSGAVDFVLEPAAMPGKLLEIKRQIANRFNIGDDIYEQILKLLRHNNGVDFTYYKQTTIRRRMARRMAISKIENSADYLAFLKDNKAATTALFNDLLINVTSFFRDPKVFQLLPAKVFPEIIKRLSEKDVIRIWSAGCATGEEAYSLAISLHQFLGANPLGIQIRIFASDISEVAIAKARIGFYSKSQLANVSDAVIKKYFTSVKNGYQVNRDIRDMCVFAVHNLIKDPPFAKIDLITCRNVLIYMEQFLQRKAFSTFHYALNEGGFLLLGKSETNTAAEDLFSPVAKLGKIYYRKSVNGKYNPMVGDHKEEKMMVEGKKIVRPEIVKSELHKQADALLLAKYTPASVVVNEQMDIIHIHGNITQFLQSPQGVPTYNLYKMAREGLGFELRNSILKSRESKKSVIREGIAVKYDGAINEITIEVTPLPDSVEPSYMVVFYNTIVLKTNIDNRNLTSEQISDDINLTRIMYLERELEKTHRDVQSITEDQEAFNEELQSANEELMSGSEELQSLNEELETSKEELQTSNEELININHELLVKQEQINSSRTFTEAIIATLREPIVVLDKELRIKNINRSFANRFGISKPEAEGRSIFDIQNHLFENAYMRAMLEKVLPDKIRVNDYEIKVNLLPSSESTMLLNARQLTNDAHAEQLILLAIEDITERKAIEQKLKSFAEELEIKIGERTSDLTHLNQELEMTIRDLNYANTQLQQFAYIASHDLQEPLRKILMFTSRLAVHKKNLPDSAALLLDKISVSSERMRALIQSLLEYSYLNNNDGLFVQTDLNTTLKNILVDFELLLEQRNVKVNAKVLPVIDAIPLQMNQLFYNLFSNSLKFSKPTGRPLISISSRILTPAQVKKYPELSSERSYCEILFKDNGIGFDQQYGKKIFTIFQRLHTKDAYIGTGIGLAISQKIVENHSGVIFATGKCDKGAVFHIILPIKPS